MDLLVVFLFCLVSFLNYMNRYTTPPIVGRLKEAFDVSDTLLGLVQSCFELCYVASSPLIGFMGDRLNRRLIMASSLFFSAAVGLLSSFVPESSFGLLLATRALLGVGEACCTNICPSIIGDMFVGRRRTIVLSIYQLAIPLGCGVGYMASGTVADYANDWRWAFRITPLPMLVSALLLLAFVREPQRGEAENAVGLYQTTSCTKDLAYLVRVPSFIFAGLANICAAFATGSLCYWTPDLILRMFSINGVARTRSETEVSFIFGIITIASGIFGVAAGAFLSNACLKKRCGLAADGIICGASMIFAAPAIYAALVCVQLNMIATWLLMFFGIAALSCYYALLSEITLNVVIVTRRATARAIQSTVSHLLGDAASPYISGLISDNVRLRQHRLQSPLVHPEMADFISMQTSLFMSTFIIAISGGLFLYGSLYINEDVERTKEVKTSDGSKVMTVDNDDQPAFVTSC